MGDFVEWLGIIGIAAVAGLVIGSILVWLFEPSPKKLFLERVRVMRKRMITSGHPDRKFIAKHLSDKALEPVAQLAAGKMAESLAYGTVNSALIANDAVCFVVQTHRSRTPGQAKNALQRDWGGYLAMMDKYLASDEVQGTGAEAFCHIAFGMSGEKSWAQVSLMPLTGEVFRRVPIVAPDLMTREEKAKTGNLQVTEDEDGGEVQVIWVE